MLLSGVILHAIACGPGVENLLHFVCLAIRHLRLSLCVCRCKCKLLFLTMFSWNVREECTWQSRTGKICFRQRKRMRLLYGIFLLLASELRPLLKKKTKTSSLSPNMKKLGSAVS